MKAVVYEGPRRVTVKNVPDARIERPTDVLVRITTTNICGSAFERAQRPPRCPCARPRKMTRRLARMNA